MLGNGVGSISGIIVGGSSDIARCRSKVNKRDGHHEEIVEKLVHEEGWWSTMEKKPWRQFSEESVRGEDN